MMESAAIRPFAEVLEEILNKTETSQRELVRRTRERGWGSLATISFILRRGMIPTPEATEIIARSLGVRPTVFAEYRLAVARRQLDPERVGLAQAIHNLESWGPPAHARPRDL